MMNERIKRLRQACHMTQEEFGFRIGITKSSMSTIESGKSNPSDQTIRSVCREFGANEEWLRTGVGDMFRQDAESVLDRVTQEYNLTDQEQAVVAAFLELDAADRGAIMRYINALVEKLTKPDSEAEAPSDAALAAIATAQDYSRMVGEEKKEAVEGSSFSAG